MLSKNEAKDIQSLRHKKFRDETQLFVAEGPKIVEELLTIAPKQFRKIYAKEEWLRSVSSLIKEVQHETINDIELEKISQLQAPNQVVAVLNQFATSKPAFSKTLSLYLDAIQDPGNFGTIIRIADWFGIKDIVCGEGCADLYNAKVVQSTMASIARVNVFYDQEAQWLAKQPGDKYAAALDGESLYKTEAVNGGILIIGNESKGIQPSIMQMATKRITIPRIGEAESLNAGVATGIVLSHLLKH